MPRIFTHFDPKTGRHVKVVVTSGLEQREAEKSKSEILKP